MTLGVLVNGDFFSALGVRPVLGRGFTAADDQAPGRSPVAVISYGMWQREFGGRPDVIGRPLRLNAVEFAIVGVTPEWFTGVHPFFQPALYVPRMMIREATGSGIDVLTDRTARSVDVFARLKAGVSIEQARDDMRRLAANLERENPVANNGRGAMVYSQVGYRIAEAPDNLMLSWLFFASPRWFYRLRASTWRICCCPSGRHACARRRCASRWAPEGAGYCASS